MATIASSATSVLIAHVAAHTETIRLGAGGVMLPNHAPLTIAEQFGTLATLHPGRIDLGLGRAPGTDQNTMHALRRDPSAVRPVPAGRPGAAGLPHRRDPRARRQRHARAGHHVPLYILGSSLFGAQLAAALGLPYAFASHFAPQALQDAVAVYRREFRPSGQLAEPYVIAGVNVDRRRLRGGSPGGSPDAKRARVGALLARGRIHRRRGRPVLASPEASTIEQMVIYSAVGTPETSGLPRRVRRARRRRRADRRPSVPDVDERLRSAQPLAEAVIALMPPR